MSGESFTPLRVAIAGSRSLPGVRQLLASPNRGRLFELVCAIVDDDRVAEREDLELFGVPIVQSADDIPSDYLFVMSGDHPVTDNVYLLDPGDVLGAMFAGAKETRSAMTLANGTRFLVSGPFHVPPIIDDARTRGDAAMIEAYAELHRKWMIEASYGVMMQKAIEFLAAGSMQIVNGVVWIDGVPGPCRMGDAPAVCHEHEEGVPMRCPFIST